MSGLAGYSLFSVIGLMSRFIFFVLLFFTAIQSCYSLQLGSDYNVEQFTDENGLPQNSVRGLAADEIGFVWIATEAGLTRFDGREMITYAKDRLRVRSDRFTGFRRDADDRALYCTNEHQQLVKVGGGKVSMDTKYKHSRAFDSTFLSRYEEQSGVRVDTSKTSSYMEKYCLISGNRGRYYLYTDEKIVFVRNDKVSGVLPFPGKPYFDRFPSEPNVRKRIIAETKTCVSVDNFLSIGGELFYHLNSEGPQFLKISEKGSATVSLKGDIESHPDFINIKGSIRLFRNTAENQVLAYLGRNIYLVGYAAGMSSLDTKLLVTGFDMDENLISRILYDAAAKTLFLGSVSKGFFVITPKAFQTVRESFEKDFHNVYYAHLPYSGSSVITPDGMILGAGKERSTEGQAMRGAVPTERFTLLKDRDRHIWIKKRLQVLQLTPDANRIINDWAFRDEPSLLYQGIRPGVFVGFKTGQLAYLTPGAKKGPSVEYLAKVEGKVLFLCQDVADRIWIGTSNGLYKYDLSARKLAAVHGLEQKVIRSIYASGPGQLWVTTYGDGIFLVSGSGLHKMPLDAEGLLNHAHCIVEDTQGQFWISSNKGLFRASKSDLIAFANGKMSKVLYVYYDKKNGFLINEFNGGCQPCAVSLDDGYLSFPSMNGLVWFRPDQIPMPAMGSGFIVENIRVSGKIRKDTDTIRLAYNYQHLGLDLNTPFFGHEKNLEFHYALARKGESGPAKWSRVGADHKISIFQLSPGTYTLSIRKTIGYGGKYLEKRLMLFVPLPWYFSWWFILLVVSAFFFSLRFYSHWRLQSLTRQNTALSQRVEERTRYLAKALADLESSDQALQSQLQIQMRIISVLNHDLHSPLRYLSKSIPQFLEKVEPLLSDQDALRQGRSISKSTEKVYLLTDDLLRFVKATYDKKGKIAFEDVNVSKVLAAKAAFFKDMAFENQISIVVRVPKLLSVYTNRLMLEIVIHNLLDNAIKHTFNNAITLSGTQSGQDVAVQIEDGGTGMPQEVITWMNTRAADQQNEQPHLPANLGLGLIIVREITELLEIDLKASSSPQGTSVCLGFKVA
jgi:signal transduction histidine kinase